MTPTKPTGPMPINPGNSEFELMTAKPQITPEWIMKQWDMISGLNIHIPELIKNFSLALERIEELTELKDFFEADSKFIRKDWEETNEKLSEAREEIKRLRLCMLDALGPLDGGPSTCCEGASAEFSYAVDALKRGLNEK